MGRLGDIAIRAPFSYRLNLDIHPRVVTSMTVVQSFRYIAITSH